ncbi:hypothetical protein [Desulfovibrio inopinatus]|uniref:hypothetical protein n=1 Tax=Desulfovibrio inopinatus TaxID=102109 RepID=UPI0012EB89E1|nr:hypothetical protein [Desulfovibrio inopinatus]
MRIYALPARFSLLLLLLSAFFVTGYSAPANAFDMAAYYKKTANKSKEAFLANFPYKVYLESVSFINFRVLEQHRRFLNTKIGAGDDFLYYLGENFIKIYPISRQNLLGKIKIGEKYLAKKHGVRHAQNEAYVSIGYFILSATARTIVEEVKKGVFDLSAPDNEKIVVRLRKNRVYLPIDKGTLEKILDALKAGNFDYLGDRMKLKLYEYSESVTDWLDMDSQNDVLASNIQFHNHYRDYPIASGHAVHVYKLTSRADGSKIGYAVFLRRPELNAHYFAYKDILGKFRQTQKKQSVVLATTGGFTNNLRQPEGLTVERGKVVNAVLMPDRHGLVLVDDTGGISVVNLKRKIIHLRNGPNSLLRITNPLTSLISYSKLLAWCKRFKVTLFQTQLLAYSDKLMIDEQRAKKQLRERRILVLERDKKTSVLYHVVFDIQKSSNLAVIAREIYANRVKNGKKIEAMLNLDVGSYNILDVFTKQGKKVPGPSGPVDVVKATNLIVYTR